jgi:hypothetical protein
MDRSFFFDRDNIRALRRIEALRMICGDDFAGIKLILDLMETLEGLRTQVRSLSRNNSKNKKETKPPREKTKRGARPAKPKLNQRRKRK